MKRLLTFLLIFSVLQTPAYANEDEFPQDAFWKDFLTSVVWMGEGFIKQFNITNAIQAGVAAPLTWWAFERDEAVLNKNTGDDVSGFVSFVSDSSVVASFAVVQIGMYTWGRSTDDGKMVRFAMESFSTMYLSMIETSILSYAIDVHERPTAGTNAFENNFRGNSSFPSGHIIPYSALFLKTFQFYGPWWSLIPGALMVITGYERVASGKHYLSDVVGGFFVTLFASEGVRVAGKYQDNHPAFKWIYENDLKVGYQKKKNTHYARVSWSF
ncbi:MAG: hypothetical protein DRQ88_03185 [Epsilonproteobacteria bacterium]|nr:MAG: hypothetical protein DRQ89_01575 [Campylobacterota bacterium]RLA67324.1 MAG: hypothetical protein DRQ88_03185 [Campylobacterota bacterium]